MPSSLLKFVKQYSVKIGSRRYKAVKIGNQLWMAENLDYKFPYNGGTLPIGSSGTPTTPAAWYYGNNEATYGIDGTYKCGLLYNWYAVKYLEDNKSTLLPSGWHVPSTTEFSTLATYIEGASTAGTKLKALDNSVTSNWPSGWNGTDNYNFSILPAGFRELSNAGFYFIGTETFFWTTDTYSSSESITRNFSANAAMTGYHYPIKYAFSLRLVKDVT